MFSIKTWSSFFIDLFYSIVLFSIINLLFLLSKSINFNILFTLVNQLIIKIGIIEEELPKQPNNYSRYSYLIEFELLKQQKLCMKWEGFLFLTQLLLILEATKSIYSIQI